MAERAGALVVCATPIGNLGDVTLRVLDALRDADVIEAEDTRVTRKLLGRYEITTPLESYHAHNLERRTGAVVERIASGALVALVSDAGTPGISDPGARLVDACLEAGLPVDVLPGPSAIIASIVASGLPTYAFYFGGFLPRKPGPRLRALEALAELDATLVFYESPRRTPETLSALAEALPGRRAALARELTKRFEEVLRDDIATLAERVSARELKGEVVLLVGPPPRDRETEFDEAEVARDLEDLVEEGMSVRDAVRRVSQERGIQRRAVYSIALEATGDGGEDAGED